MEQQILHDKQKNERRYLAVVNDHTTILTLKQRGKVADSIKSSQFNVILEMKILELYKV